MTPRFLLQTVPVWILGVAATAMGLALGDFARGPVSLSIAITGGLVCYFAAHSFPQRMDWGMVFLVGLGLAAGVALASLPWLATSEVRLSAAGLALVGLAAAAAAGRSMPGLLRPLYPPLWIGAWIQVICLSVIQLTGLWSGGARPAATVAAVVFGGLTAAWFARVEDRPAPPAAMDLYLLALNLFLASGVLLAPPA
ncbi:MAG TPA: hypothetical protein VFI11_04150 [Anaerolineales bacterium]|nr:hypothetical protein [Anaerolineales bacterium]